MLVVEILVQASSVHKAEKKSKSPSAPTIRTGDVKPEIGNASRVLGVLMLS